MGDNFKNFKNMIHDDIDSFLPSELDWNQMNKGIAEKMQSIKENETFEKNKKASRRKIFLLFSVAILLFAGFMYMINKDNINGDNHTRIQTQASDVAISSNTIVNKSNDEFQDLMPEIHDQTFDNVISQSKIGDKNKVQHKNTFLIIDEYSEKMQTNSSVGNLHANTQSSEESTDHHVYSQRPTFTENKVLSSNENLLRSSFPSIKEEQEQIDPNSNQNGLPLSFSTMRPMEHITKCLEPLSVSPLSVEKTDIDKAKLSLDNLWLKHDSLEQQDNSDKLKDRLIIESGVTFWNQGYSSSEPQNKNYETTLVSFNLQGHYVKSFDRNYFGFIGMQYQVLQSKFEYSQTIEDYKITLKDTIIQIQNNSFTGTQNVIRGDVEYTVNAERRIRHYNSSRLFKTSLGLGKSWQSNSFQVDLYFGGAINIFAYNEGKLLYGDSVISYKNNNSPIIDNKYAIDGLIGTRFNYFFSPKIAITCGLQAQKTLMNWSKVDNIKIRPGSFSLQLGVGIFL